MAEKKATKKAVVTKAAAEKKPATVKKVAEKQIKVTINAENVGFKAGDVYQALSTSGKAMSVSEIAKEAKISEEETLLGMGWLFKEGKIKDENNLIALA
jgi:predicted DNA-binding transcriptional regulator